MNKKVLESLTLAGAFDSIAEVNRASLFASLETLLEHAGDEQQERELGQTSLFDSFGSDEVKMVTSAANVFKNEEDYPMSRKLLLEKQVVGFYVSGHPMDTWQRICEDWLGWSTEKIKLYAQEKAAKKQAAPAADQGFEYGAGPLSRAEDRSETRGASGRVPRSHDQEGEPDGFRGHRGSARKDRSGVLSRDLRDKPRS